MLTSGRSRGLQAARPSVPDDVAILPFRASSGPTRGKGRLLMSSSSGDPVRYLEAILASLKAVSIAANRLSRGPIPKASVVAFSEAQENVRNVVLSDEAAVDALALKEQEYQSWPGARRLSSTEEYPE